MKDKKKVEDIDIDEMEDIEDVDEVEDIDEVDEIEEEILEDDDDEEIPAPKSKKSKTVVKKKKSKGKKAIIAIAIVLIVILALGGVFYFIVLPMLSGEEASADYTGTIGNTMPTGITAKNTLSKSMKASEMMVAAVDNYYNADYAASICVNGGVVTTISVINVNQGVNSLKIREGKASDADAKYFVYSKSFGIANMWEEYYYSGSTVSYRKADKPSKVGEGSEARLVATSWAVQDPDFADLDAFMDATSTDFTKIWAYEATEDTIAADSDETVTYDASKKCYFFTVKLNTETAVADYVEVMKYQLGSNMGMEVKELDFTQLELEFCVWENGFIRYLAVHESYSMNLAKVPVIGKLNGMIISNNCMNEYGFDPNEKIKYDTGLKNKETIDLDIESGMELF